MFNFFLLSKQANKKASELSESGSEKKQQLEGGEHKRETYVSQECPPNSLHPFYTTTYIYRDREREKERAIVLYREPSRQENKKSHTLITENHSHSSRGEIVLEWLSSW